MSANEFLAWLAKQPSPIESATVVARRFNCHTSTVTNRLVQSGYIRTEHGWELPTKERPVNVFLSLDDAVQIIRERLTDDHSIVKFTSSHRAKLLAKSPSPDKLIQDLGQLLLTDPDPKRILYLALAIYFSDPAVDYWTAERV